MKEKFIQFLKDNDALGDYNFEVGKAGFSLDEITKTYEADDWIIAAFNWPDDTVEYWDTLAHKWMDIVEEDE